MTGSLNADIVPQYVISVTARDQLLLSDTETLTILVGNIDQAPRFTTPPITITMDEEKVYDA